MAPQLLWKRQTLGQLGAHDGLNIDGGEPNVLIRVSGTAEHVVWSVLGFHAVRLENLP